MRAAYDDDMTSGSTAGGNGPPATSWWQEWRSGPRSVKASFLIVLVCIVLSGGVK